MRKILVLFGIIAFLEMNAMAYLNEGETSDMSVLEKQGFSRSTMEIVDWAKYRNSGTGGKYVRYYQPKKGRFLGRPYQQIKEYVDPFQDHGRFGDGQIEFSNTWTGDKTFYSSDRKATKKVEQL